MSDGEQGWRQYDHTADVAIELWAPTEEALLVEGARALVSIMTEEAEVEPCDARAVSLDDCVDDEDRLVQWLNEIIFLTIYEHFLTRDAELTLTDEGLVGTLRGEEGARERLRGELKSATYHDLQLTRTDDGIRARVVIDV